MERWKLIDNASEHDAGVTETAEGLLSLVDDIAELLEKEEGLAETRETDLELEQLFKKPSHVWIMPALTSYEHPLKAVRTRVGSFVFRRDDLKDVVLYVGDLIDDGDGPKRVSNIEQRYVGANVRYVVCEVL